MKEENSRFLLSLQMILLAYKDGVLLIPARLSYAKAFTENEEMTDPALTAPRLRPPIGKYKWTN